MDNDGWDCSFLYTTLCLRKITGKTAH